MWIRAGDEKIGVVFLLVRTVDKSRDKTRTLEFSNAVGFYSHTSGTHMRNAVRSRTRLGSPIQFAYSHIGWHHAFTCVGIEWRLTRGISFSF